MKPLPREYFNLAERIIGRFPWYKKELIEWERAIVAWCHQIYPSDGTSSENTSASEPERIVEAKDKNRRYQLLLGFVDTVELALKRLTKEELEIIELSCWEGEGSKEIAKMLNIHERSVRKIKSRAFRKMAPLLLSTKTIRLELAS